MELLRFWRSLPRLAVGMALLLEVIAFNAGDDPIREIALLAGKTRSALGETANGVLLGLCVIAAGVFAAEVARIILLPLRFIFSAMFRKISPHLHGTWQWRIAVLGQAPGLLAYQLFEENRSFMSDLWKAWSLGSAPTPDYYRLIEEVWEKHFELIETTLRQLVELPQELWRLTYFVNVTQEKADADYIESLAEVVQLAWLALALAPIVAIRLGWIDILPSVLSVTVFAMALLIPTYVRRKLNYVVYLIFQHLNALTIADAADVADRAED